MEIREEPTSSLLVTLNDSEVAALDAWISQQPQPRPSREAAATLAVCDWLIAVRQLPPDACR
jgi:cytochrome c553